MKQAADTRLFGIVAVIGLCGIVISILMGAVLLKLTLRQLARSIMLLLSILIRSAPYLAILGELYNAHG